MSTLHTPDTPPRTTRRFLLLAGFVALAFASSARAWWDDGWTLRKKITIDPAAAGFAATDPVGTVPVLLRLHDGNFNFASANADGSDLRFVAEDDKTMLTYHIERYDSLLNEAYVWVRVPDVAPGARTTFWLYYGNADKKAATVADAKATYDATTSLVYHFAEAGRPVVDATSYGNDAQGAPVADDGALIASGLRLDGKQLLTVPASPSLAWTAGAPLTWSAWIKFPSNQPGAVLFNRQDGANAFAIGVDDGVPFVEVVDAAGSHRSATAARVAANAWHHLAVVGDNGTFTLWIDGQSYATLAATLPALNSPITIGGVADDPAGALAGRPGFIGEIDELQIAKSARAVGFIKFQALEQGGSEAAAKMVVLGEDEQPSSLLSGLKTGYLGVILGSLSVDGWVVIGLLGVMGVVSWIVMIGKARYLNRVGRGNAQFLEQWRKVASDLSVLDAENADQARSLGAGADSTAHRAMRGAPLYRIYHIGVEEIRHRLAAEKSGAAKVISARSIEAIRASLDGGLVRETQRLNSQMVLLTIAISGGPFLGLLGTVVGVMITFAAVAAAGDVNVNAIAPGIAAALAATVAGLAVAIPSLFGYNYLLTRVKSTSSDMHVFIDEFTARLAEFYGGDSE